MARSATKKRGIGRGKKMSKKDKKRLAVGAAVAVGLWLFFKGKGGSSSSVIVLQPAAVKKGETITVETYRTLSARRSGMHYDQASSGAPGGPIEFVVGKSGNFTRNFVQEGGQLWAEIA